jgi:hypothetical protein
MHSLRLRPESEYDVYGIEDKIEPYCSNIVDASRMHTLDIARCSITCYDFSPYGVADRLHAYVLFYLRGLFIPRINDDYASR